MTYWLPGGILFAAWLWPFVVIALFVCEGVVARIFPWLGMNENDVPVILLHQYEFISASGIIAQLHISSLQIFGLVIWITSALLLLHLLTGPLLFLSAQTPRRPTRAPRMTPAQLIASGLVLGAGAIVGALDIKDAMTASQLRFVLRHWPNFYVGFEACLFAAGALFVVTSLLLLLRLLAFRSDEERWRPLPEEGRRS